MNSNQSIIDKKSFDSILDKIKSSHQNDSLELEDTDEEIVFDVRTFETKPEPKLKENVAKQSPIISKQEQALRNSNLKRFISTYTSRIQPSA